MDQLDTKFLDNIEWLRDDGLNWRVWKAQTLIALEHREVLDFIRSPSSRPAPIVLSPGDKAEDGSSQRSGYTIANADKMAAWDRGNRVARMQVFMMLEHAV